jgi:hypothetical protein
MKLFPIVHLLALIVGGMILLFVKRKYRKVRTAELIIAFILLFMLVSIFTEPGLDLIKKMISLMQVE